MTQWRRTYQTPSVSSSTATPENSSRARDLRTRWAVIPLYLVYWLIRLLFYIPLRNNSLIWRRQHCRAVKDSNIYGLCTTLKAYEQGSLLCHIFCDTWPQPFEVSSGGPSHLVTFYDKRRVVRTYSNPNPHRIRLFGEWPSFIWCIMLRLLRMLHCGSLTLCRCKDIRVVYHYSIDTSKHHIHWCINKDLSLLKDRRLIAGNGDVSI